MSTTCMQGKRREGAEGIKNVIMNWVKKKVREGA